jgi:hypothetical protein
MERVAVEKHSSTEDALLHFFAKEFEVPAVVGACIGVLGSYPGDRHRSISRALAFGFAGWAIGLGAGVAWETRGLTERVTSTALRNIGRMRDERWLEKNPIDYA